MKDQRPINPWSLSSEGLQLVVTLLMGVFIGYQLDKRFSTSPWCTVGGATLGIIAGLYNFLKRFL
jgi:F0F1-type ATP synthase assembly protein I